MTGDEQPDAVTSVAAVPRTWSTVWVVRMRASARERWVWAAAPATWWLTCVVSIDRRRCPVSSSPSPGWSGSGPRPPSTPPARFVRRWRREPEAALEREFADEKGVIGNALEHLELRATAVHTEDAGAHGLVTLVEARARRGTFSHVAARLATETAAQYRACHCVNQRPPTREREVNGHAVRVTEPSCCNQHRMLGIATELHESWLAIAQVRA